MRQRSNAGIRQALRTTPAPAHLQSWLDVVNGLPAVNTVDDFSTLLLMGYDIEAKREVQICELRKRTAGWGRSAIAYIFRSDVDPAKPLDRLNEVVSAWVTFLQIAEFGASHRASEDRVFTGGPGEGARLISHEGELRVEVAPFLKMMDGIEVDRIRLCPICRKFFWAGRRDKSACSPPCQDNLRQRRFRENRAYKSRIATKRSKKGRSV